MNGTNNQIRGRALAGVGEPRARRTGFAFGTGTAKRWIRPGPQDWSEAAKTEVKMASGKMIQVEGEVVEVLPDRRFTRTYH